MEYTNCLKFGCLCRRCLLVNYSYILHFTFYKDRKFSVEPCFWVRLPSKVDKISRSFLFLSHIWRKIEICTPINSIFRIECLSDLDVWIDCDGCLNVHTSHRVLMAHTNTRKTRPYRRISWPLAWQRMFIIRCACVWCGTRVRRDRAPNTIHLNV